MIIGLSGYAQVGKDTAAQILVEDYGYTRIGFADIIKKSAYVLDPIITLDGMRLAHAVDKYGWEAAKQVPEVRRLLQVLGSEVGRDLIDPQIWVEVTMHAIHPDDKIVISDVRFANEAEEIKWKKGQIWRITRVDKSEPVNVHKSETEMDKWNFDEYVPNNGTIQDLKQEIAAIMGKK